MPAEKVRIKVDSRVSLEAEFRPGPGAGHKGVLVLHPHPLYGGSMRNNVVKALLTAAEQAGRAGLRFNFRGVGDSTGEHDQGRGEVEDVHAALAWLNARGVEDLVLMGYSFGALVGVQAALSADRFGGGVLVAPPFILGELPPWPTKHGPLLVLSGDQDPYCGLAELKRYADQLGSRCQMFTEKGGDHFWMGRESALIREATVFLNDLEQLQNAT